MKIWVFCTNGEKLDGVVLKICENFSLDNEKLQFEKFLPYKSNYFAYKAGTSKTWSLLKVCRW